MKERRSHSSRTYEVSLGRTPMGSRALSRATRSTDCGSKVRSNGGGPSRSPASDSPMAKTLLQSHPPQRLRGRDDLDTSEEHTSELQSRGRLVCRLLRD